MAQNGPADSQAASQDEEATFTIGGWFSGSNSLSALDIASGTETDPFNWSNTFLKVYGDFGLLERMRENAQNPLVIRKLAAMEEQLLIARSEADLLPLPKLRIRLEEMQAKYFRATDKQDRTEISDQLAMLRLNICSQALVRVALADFYNKSGKRDYARTNLIDAERRAAELTETSGELECTEYLLKVRSEVS